MSTEHVLEGAGHEQGIGFASDAAGQTVHQFSFTGESREFFRIWIPGFLLTILTLGIYSAWASVRNRRYFYHNTRLNGHHFDYHASPASLLLLRVMYALLLAIFFLEGGELLIDLAASLAPALWAGAIVHGLSLNARSSSYRGVFSSFRRGYLIPVILCYVAPLGFIVVMIALGDWLYLFILTLLESLSFPEGLSAVKGALESISIFYLAAVIVNMALFAAVVRCWHQFKIPRHRIGSFQILFAAPSIFAYMLPWLICGILVWCLYVQFPLLTIVHEEIELNHNYMVAWPLFAAFSFSFLRGCFFRLRWNGVRTEKGAAVRCDFSLAEFARKISLPNVVAIICSLGLLYPWAAVRRARYLAEHMSVSAPPGMLEEIHHTGGDDVDAVKTP